jgi:hypothetical protein
MLAVEQLAVVIERGRGVEALWGSTPMVTGMQAPFSTGGRDTRRAGRLGAGTVLC